ncbi:hypothetical protein SAY87_010863 [Trapa incisa]|uniref:DUF789 family protein n=1 Tax=Trapa incisa TaxID=236973 RepID=A0AAN7GF97_9MYRT|nr:hypothetical protein SAY87_010863 [Trapa incisa]
MPVSGRVSVARSRRGEDRFYCPPALRKQQVDSRTSNLGTQSEKTSGPVTESDQPVLESVSRCSVSGKSQIDCFNSNLDRFLEWTTPRVPVKCLPKAKLSRLRSSQLDDHIFFKLGDLWDSFTEWSAYGAGVPLLLNGSDYVIQYYVPYLSGIQLYIDPSRSLPQRRGRPGEESDADSSLETSSDIHRFNGLSIKDQPSTDSSCDEAEIPNPPGQLVFEYLACDPPYSRKPLFDKILTLSSEFPGLWEYQSCDLSSSSWISIAWYPIYRIPTGPTLQNLDACFLTFHSLSTCGYKNNETLSKLPLATFGLASYKFKRSVWNPVGMEEYPKASSLFRAADNWLRLLQVNHPDFNFFISHSMYFCPRRSCCPMPQP